MSMTNNLLKTDLSNQCNTENKLMKENKKLIHEEMAKPTPPNL